MPNGNYSWQRAKKGPGGKEASWSDREIKQMFEKIVLAHKKFDDGQRVPVSSLKFFNKYVKVLDDNDNLRSNSSCKTLYQKLKKKMTDHEKNLLLIAGDGSNVEVEVNDGVVTITGEEVTPTEINMSDSASEEEYEVESIVDKRLKKGKPEYFVKWKNWPAEDNTWEPIDNLDCHDLVEAYEENLKNNEKKAGEKRKAEPEKKSDKSTKKSASRPKGFCRGLAAEKIIGATNDPGELYFLIKWKGSDEADLVAAKEANIKIPQVVIKFYEERLNWYEDDK